MKKEQIIQVLHSSMKSTGTINPTNTTNNQNVNILYKINF